MARYRLLAGRHIGENGETYTKGAVFESKYDLEKQNSPGSYKFQRVADSEKVEDTAPKSAPESDTEDVSATEDEETVNTESDADESTNTAIDTENLEASTVPELRAFAKENEIDLGGAERKADIISALKSALELE